MRLTAGAVVIHYILRLLTDRSNYIVTIPALPLIKTYYLRKEKPTLIKIIRPIEIRSNYLVRHLERPPYFLGSCFFVAPPFWAFGASFFCAGTAF